MFAGRHWKSFVVVAHREPEEEDEAPKPVDAAPPAVPEEGTGLPPNIAATICALLPPVGGIVFYVLERKNAFVRFWAMQSILFGLALAAIWVLLLITGFVLGKIPILGWLILVVASWSVRIATLVVLIISVINAVSNKEWEIPYIGKLARKQLAGEKLS